MHVYTRESYDIGRMCSALGGAKKVGMANKYAVLCECLVGSDVEAAGQYLP